VRRKRRASIAKALVVERRGANIVEILVLTAFINSENEGKSVKL